MLNNQRKLKPLGLCNLTFRILMMSHKNKEQLFTWVLQGTEGEGGKGGGGGARDPGEQREKEVWYERRRQ